MKEIPVESLLEHLNEYGALATVSYRDDPGHSYTGVRFLEEVAIIDRERQSHVVARGQTLLLPYDSELGDWTRTVLIVSDDQVSKTGRYDPGTPEKEYIPRTLGAIRTCLPGDFPEIPSSSRAPNTTIEPC